MIQLIQPDLTIEAQAGWCLYFIQEVYKVPHLYRSAYEAYQATQFKHTDALPDVSVPVWFEHWGTYGTPPTYGNWGHVVAYVPGKGFLSVIGKGYGQQWFKTIAEVEQHFNAKYVGWSEDISGIKLVKETIMVDLSQANVLYRFYKGTEISNWGLANAVGKLTFQQLQQHLINSTEFKALIVKAKAGTLNVTNHIPSALREAYTPPQVPIPNVTTLKKGIYEVI